MFSQPKPAGEKGQGLVEYALILSLVAVAVIVVLVTLGPAISGVYCQVVSELDSNAECDGGYRLFDSYDDFGVACNGADGLIASNVSIPEDIEAQGYLFGKQCVDAEAYSGGSVEVLWIGYYKTE